MKKIILFIISFILFSFFLGCNEINDNPNENNEKKVTRIEVDTSLIDEWIKKEDFSLELIKLKIYYSDDSTDTISLAEEMIENYDYNSLKKGINSYDGDFNLKDLQLKDKYFKMFDTIEEAYKELLPYFNENQYNLKIEENNLSLNIEIEHSHKKNIIPFILQKSEIKNDDLIKNRH